jgi:transcriptional regulator with XRE-family HTH domain
MSVASTRYRPHRPVGDLLREWRQRRQLSQLDLSLAAEVSARHLSFVETGRSKPTSEMILRLTEHLEVPLRDRNTLLLAGGYAPAYPEHRLDGPELAAVRAALRHVLAGHDPYPAVVVNRWWELSLFSMTAVVGTPMDVTIEELAIESFYPADQATAEELWARREGLAEPGTTAR